MACRRVVKCWREQRKATFRRALPPFLFVVRHLGDPRNTKWGPAIRAAEGAPGGVEGPSMGC
eukprot:7511897-Alexandrium_andersonii.AAC.1